MTEREYRRFRALAKREGLSESAFFRAMLEVHSRIADELEGARASALATIAAKERARLAAIEAEAVPDHARATRDLIGTGIRDGVAA